MEYLNEDCMYYMDCTSQDINPEVTLNDSNQSMSAQEIQTEAEPEEIEQPLYKLKNVDTESSVKTEIKQLILTKISEEISSNILDHMTYDAEEQISTLRDKTEILENKIQELDKEVETDEERLAQTEIVLMKTNEMISLLTENIEKLSIRCRESSINELTEISAQQMEKLNSLKTSYLSQIDREKEILKNQEAAGIERNSVLKSKLTQEDEILKRLKKKQDEFKKIISSCNDELDKNTAKKQALEHKLMSVTDNRGVLESEFIKQRDTIKNLSLKITHVDKSELIERKTALESQLEAAEHEMEEAKASLARNENLILEKELNIKELRNKLENVKQDYQESFQKLQKNYNDSHHQLDEISTNIATCHAKNDNLLDEINILNAKCIQKCEEKLSMINRNFEKQMIMQKEKIDLLKKQTENKIEYTKYEELRSQYEKSVELLQSLENEAVKEQDKNCDELRQLKLKIEVAQEEHNKYFLEMKKKKEYLLANSKFLEEKLENIKRDRIEMAKSVKYCEEENASLKALIEKKQNQLDERKNALNALRKVQLEGPLKSGFKSPSMENIPKKVKFNEILSFKSPSSSEVSNVPVGSVTQLETSVHDWLGESKQE